LCPPEAIAVYRNFSLGQAQSPGQALLATVDTEIGASIAVSADHETGPVTIQLAARPSVKMPAAPEIPPDLSLHLMSRIDHLRQDRS
jgi:hypothetical protein